MACVATIDWSNCSDVRKSDIALQPSANRHQHLVRFLFFKMRMTDAFLGHDHQLEGTAT